MWESLSKDTEDTLALGKSGLFEKKHKIWRWAYLGYETVQLASTILYWVSWPMVLVVNHQQQKSL